MALSDWQCSLGTDLILSEGNQILIHDLSGLGVNVKSADIDRDGQSGTWQGDDYNAARTLKLSLTVISGAATPQYWAERISRNWNSVGVTGDQEFGFKFPGLPELAVLGRARRVVYPEGRRLGRPTIPMELEFDDRLGYSLYKYERTAQGDLTDSSDGATWPWTWPVSFSSSSSSEMTCPNSGSFAALPIIRFNGGATNPRVLQPSTGKFLGIQGTIAPGKWIELDCDKKTVVDQDGAPARHRLQTGSTWLSLPRNTSTLRYSATGDIGSLVTARWRLPYAF